MCLIALNWQPDSDQPLLLIANRDEFHRRPTRPAQPWPESPSCLGGRDLSAGGGWLAVNQNGRFAAVTNVRLADEMHREFLRSRGELVRNFLLSEESAEIFATKSLARAEEYAGFNLLVSDGDELWHANNRMNECQRLSAGIHVVSNASLSDRWPKMESARRILVEQAKSNVVDHSRLFLAMEDTQIPNDDDLPDTGVGKEFERYVSPVFIAGAEYGTRATTLIRLGRSQSELVERRFAPNAVISGESFWRWTHT